MPRRLRPDAVIFDLDGTLWNASAASAAGWNEALAESGIDADVTAAQMVAVTGNHMEACVDLLLPGLRALHPGLVEALERGEEAAVRREGGQICPGAVEAVSELALDTRVFIVSNCTEWYLLLFLEIVGLEEAVSGFDCHGVSGRPKSQMLERMKRVHSLARPVYVGDTAGDEEAAAAAGMDFIHVSWGFGRPAGTPKVVDSFAELLDHVGGDRP